MPQTRRERLREATREEIKNIARQQIAEHGAPALSLRAIATEMGLTPPALYRYFDSRDALVTALIVDAYHSLADALETAAPSVPPGDYRSHLLAVTLAYRDWALSYPQDYALVFGTPIPGYQGPVEIIVPAASRSMDIFLTLLEAAWQAGQLNLQPEDVQLSPELHALLEGWQQRYDLTPATPILHLALAAWGQMHGLVTLELFHHLQPMVSDPGELYRFEMAAFLKRIGLK
jgi:AcrR family transcriptional regulator